MHKQLCYLLNTYPTYAFSCMHYKYIANTYLTDRVCLLYCRFGHAYTVLIRLHSELAPVKAYIQQAFPGAILKVSYFTCILAASFTGVIFKR